MKCEISYLLRRYEISRSSGMLQEDVFYLSTALPGSASGAGGSGQESWRSNAI